MIGVEKVNFVRAYQFKGLQCLFASFSNSLEVSGVMKEIRLRKEMLGKHDYEYVILSLGLYILCWLQKVLQTTTVTNSKHWSLNCCLTGVMSYLHRRLRAPCPISMDRVWNFLAVPMFGTVDTKHLCILLGDYLYIVWTVCLMEIDINVWKGWVGLRTCWDVSRSNLPRE